MSDEKRRIRVLIVDDHQVVRQGLRTFLELNDGMQVVGEAGDGLAAVALARQLAPDVVLMDLVMPGLDGISATQQIRALDNGARVIALTSFTEDDKVFPALQAGASSYLLKDVTPEALVEAIEAAQRGEARLHPEVLRKLVKQASRQPALSAPLAPGAALTAREGEVIRLVAQGRSNREIAAQLSISEKTAKAHVSHILAKLGLEDRTQMAVYALRHGLASVEPGQAGENR